MTTDAKGTTTANVLGTIGTVLWCIQLIPQIIHNYRRKDCTGLPPAMMLLWALSGVPFAIYFTVQKANIPVQVQPQVFLTLALICYAQTLYYPPKPVQLWKVVTLCCVLLVIFAGVEAGFIIPFLRLYERGITWPNLIIGVIAAILLAAGLVPPYFEIYKRNGQVVGINFIFLCIDTSGAIFSVFSLVTQHGSLDILGCVLYIIIIVLEGGIFLSQGIWLLRTRKARKQAKELEQMDAETHDVVVVVHDDLGSIKEEVELREDEKTESKEKTLEENLIATTSEPHDSSEPVNDTHESSKV